MNTAQRRDIRNGLAAMGLHRHGHTDDLDACGDYTETWAHPDGTTLTINWSAYDLPADTNQWSRHLTSAIDRAEPRDPDQSHGDWSGSISAATLANVSAEVADLAQSEVVSAPGMYDEPDEGLDFGVPTDDRGL